MSLHSDNNTYIYIQHKISILDNFKDGNIDLNDKVSFLLNHIKHFGLLFNKHINPKSYYSIYVN